MNRNPLQCGKTVCHLTSVHPRHDTRIFYKQCRSLARAGHEVSLVVADGKGDETIDGVRVHDVGVPTGRLDRMINVSRRVFAKAAELDADVYHFHDPELIPIGLRLKRKGKPVIFDSHEDVPKQLLGKAYLGKPARMALSGLLEVYERYACRRFDAVVAATPFIRDKFLRINPTSVDINNYPMPGELAPGTAEWSMKQPWVAYVGSIAGIRGIREMVEAMALVRTDVRLRLGGACSVASFMDTYRQYPGWDRVDELGFLDRGGVRDTLARSLAGLVTLHPTRNYIDSLPVKMFEYMSAGIPVIASDFPLWKKIVEGKSCGLCVDPMDPKAIAKAIDFLVANQERAREMGENGRRAVIEHYNWSIEKNKLLNLYQMLLRGNRR